MRNCVICGQPFDALRANFCSATCRKRSSRGMPSIAVNSLSNPVTKGTTSISNGDNSVNNGDNSLVKATHLELEAAGVLDTIDGQQAMRLATQMCGRETAGGMASLSKEFSRVKAEALRAAVALVADPIDELARRREAKLAAG